jgi:c-di-GMP-binding flagellar brake protein YcgR
MLADKTIGVGDKVELFILKSYQLEAIADGGLEDLPPEEGAPYKTMIEDVNKKNGFFLVSVPSAYGQAMPLRDGHDVHMAYNRTSGRYVAHMKVTGFLMEKEIRYAWLKLVAGPIKKQRRGYYRLPVKLKVMVCEYIENAERVIPVKGDMVEVVGLETAGTNNISVTGIAIETKEEYKEGEKYLLKVFFDDGSKKSAEMPPFLICAEVMRTAVDAQTKKTFVGMHFFGQTERMSEHIAKYVMEQQKKMLAKR